MKKQVLQEFSSLDKHTEILSDIQQSDHNQYPRTIKRQTSYFLYEEPLNHTKRILVQTDSDELSRELRETNYNKDFYPISLKPIQNLFQNP